MLLRSLKILLHDVVATRKLAPLQRLRAILLLLLNYPRQIYLLELHGRNVVHGVLLHVELAVTLRQVALLDPLRHTVLDLQEMLLEDTERLLGHRKHVMELRYDSLVHVCLTTGVDGAV